MSRAKENPGAATRSLSELIERTVLAVLLALIPLRAVLSEIHTFEVPRGLRLVEAPPTASPAATYALVSLVFVAAGVVACLRLSGRIRAYHVTGAEFGASLLAVAMAWSTLRAGQKHLALISSLDTASAILYFVILRQLLASPARIRLALSVVLATGVMLISKCAYQRWIEWPDTLEFYRLHKDELLAQGRSSEGFIHDYERRLESGAVTGYFNHPNVLASYLLLVVFTAFAVIRARWSAASRGFLIGPALIAVAGVVTLLAAQSKGAVAAGVVGLLVWQAARLFRARIRSHPILAVAAAGLLIALIGVGLVGILRARPDALGRSMLFRWFYWQGAAAMLVDHGPGGLGGGNFSRFFTAYKPPECPEDVEDPHSWVVKAAVDWGVLGLVGLLAMFSGISVRLARTCRMTGQTDAAGPLRDCPASRPSAILWSAGLAAIFLAGWFCVIRDASPAYLLLTIHVPLIAWFAGFFLATYSPGETSRATEVVAPMIFAPLVAGLIAFLLHSAIDLALFLGGPATAFFALLAVLSSAAEAKSGTGRTTVASSRRDFATVLVGGICVTAGLLMTFKLTLPAARTAAALEAARTFSPAGDFASFAVSPVGQSYRRAIVSCRLDATALDEYLEALSERVQTIAEVDELLSLVNEFARRDPHNALIAHHRATLYYQRFAIAAGDAPPTRSAMDDLDQSVEWMKRSVAAYPSHPARRLYLADLLVQRAEAARRPQDRLDAAGELEKALEMDARRVYVSPPHRLTESTKQSLQRRIAELRAAAPGAS